jgi:hypothetical protein
MSRPTTPVELEPVSEVQQSLINLIGQFNEIKKQEELQETQDTQIMEVTEEWPPKEIESELQNQKMFEKFIDPDQEELQEDLEVIYQSVTGNHWRIIDSLKHLAYQLEKIKHNRDKEEQIEMKEQEEADAIEVFYNTYRDIEFNNVINLNRAMDESRRQIGLFSYRKSMELLRDPILLPEPMRNANTFTPEAMNNGEPGYKSVPNSHLNGAFAFIRNLRK